MFSIGLALIIVVGIVAFLEDIIGKENEYGNKEYALKTKAVFGLIFNIGLVLMAASIIIFVWRVLP